MSNISLPTGALTRDLEILVGDRAWRLITGPSGTVLATIAELDSGLRVSDVCLLDGGAVAKAVLETTEDLTVAVDGDGFTAGDFSPRDSWSISVLNGSPRVGLCLGSTAFLVHGSPAQLFLLGLHRALFDETGLVRGTGGETGVPQTNVLRLGQRRPEMVSMAYLFTEAAPAPVSCIRLPAAPNANHTGESLYLLSLDGSLVGMSPGDNAIFGASSSSVRRWLTPSSPETPPDAVPGLTFLRAGEFGTFRAGEDGTTERTVFLASTGDGRFLATQLKDGEEEQSFATAGRVDWRNGTKPEYVELGFDRVPVRLTDGARCIVLGFGLGTHQLTLLNLKNGEVTVRRRVKGVFDRSAGQMR